MERRDFLLTSALAGAAAFPILSSAQSGPCPTLTPGATSLEMPQRANLSDEESASVAVVNELLAAFVSRDPAKMAAMFTADALFTMGPPDALPPATFPNFFSELARATRVDIEVKRAVVFGPIVMNERFDRLIWPERTITGRWIGVFVVKGDKVARLTEYTMERHVEPTRAG